MRFSLLLVLVGSSPILAQYSGGSLIDRPRSLDKPISTGLVRPEPPEEALIDREAWLREPIPQEQISRLRAGLLRPDRGTVWREPSTLPSDESLQAQELLLESAIRRMQGLWRAKTLMVDDGVSQADAFRGLNYRITDTLVEQSDAWEPMARTPAPSGPSRLQFAVDAAQYLGMSPRQVDQVLRQTPEDREYWAGVTAKTRQAGEVMHKDIEEREALRLSVVFRGPGQAIVYSWDRYGESGDPYNLLNRPSERVVFPTMGAIEVNEDQMVLAIRGIGSRGILPGNLQRPLGVERTTFIRMGRDEIVTNSTNPVPYTGAPTGDLSLFLGLGEEVEGETAQPLLEAAQAGSWVVRPLTPVKLGGAPALKRVVPEPMTRPGETEPRRNIIPQMKRVPLGNTGKK